ncbi:uncharacterized protein AMSG_02427 [Thecamonas trahens ATCC 50062]|uniref:Uncharacterized protein n=1 Tax=Thecamonas trahens ATCC 50062 TaxID=461836 RepID=A0A0L0DY28_THETB|nr:hypothetical protein AMSG_02427 [Thecamonas trahens ATCC 50062]KNC56458.1 hypothetical protein AMSG_02427 [Thecamonas trahens ATCC 50062]|eukprot:XP_013760968.1 hypothetical protein AMSG_02427 [Thecamonas trahens ATCC 50062]
MDVCMRWWVWCCCCGCCRRNARVSPLHDPSWDTSLAGLTRAYLWAGSQPAAPLPPLPPRAWAPVLAVDGYALAAAMAHLAPRHDPVLLHESAERRVPWLASGQEGSSRQSVSVKALGKAPKSRWCRVDAPRMALAVFPLGLAARRSWASFLWAMIDGDVLACVYWAVDGDQGIPHARALLRTFAPFLALRPLVVLVSSPPGVRLNVAGVRSNLGLDQLGLLHVDVVRVAEAIERM